MQTVSEIHSDEDSSRRRVNAHVVGCVVEELGACVALNIVRVVVAPAQLHVQPIFLRRRAVHRVLGVGEKRRSRDVPLGGGEEEDVGARAVHLVRLSRMDRLLLNSLDSDGVQLLIEHLQTQETSLKIRSNSKANMNSINA